MRDLKAAWWCSLDRVRPADSQRPACQAAGLCPQWGKLVLRQRKAQGHPAGLQVWGLRDRDGTLRGGGPGGQRTRTRGGQCSPDPRGAQRGRRPGRPKHGHPRIQLSWSPKEAGVFFPSEPPGDFISLLEKRPTCWRPALGRWPAAARQDTALAAQSHALPAACTAGFLLLHEDLEGSPLHTRRFPQGPSLLFAFSFIFFFN